jgi:hypothetical protein
MALNSRETLVIISFLSIKTKAIRAHQWALQTIRRTARLAARLTAFATKGPFAKKEDGHFLPSSQR